jgi:hypothetical protein
MIYLSKLKRIFNDNFSSIDISPDGEGCMVRMFDEWILFCPNQKPKRFEENEITFSIGWNPQSTLYAGLTRDMIKLWKRTENESFSIKISENIESYRNNVRWEATGESFIFEVEGNFRTPYKIFRIDLIGNFTPLELNGLSPNEQRMRSYTPRIFTLGASHGTLFRSEKLGNVLINKSDVKAWPESSIPIGVSPSGRYRIFEGPSSYRSKEGVTLLRVEEWKEKMTELPLIRFYGKIDSPIKWSPDESRFAFLVHRKNAEYNCREALLFSRPGDRYAETVSIQGQEPKFFTWISPNLVKTFEKFSQ